MGSGSVDGAVTEHRAFGVAASTVSSFGVDATGNLYVLEVKSGRVLKIVAG